MGVSSRIICASVRTRKLGNICLIENQRYLLQCQIEDAYTARYTYMVVANKFIIQISFVLYGYTMSK